MAEINTIAIEPWTCPMCGGKVEFEMTAQVYNKHFRGQCTKCEMVFCYQERHEQLEHDYEGLGMRVKYYNRWIPKNEPFEKVFSRRVNSNNKLTDDELADLFGYCARLASMVAPADVKKYYGFTFDGAVKDTFYGLAMLYGGEGITHNIEEFRKDELYGPTLEQMLFDIRRILDPEFPGFMS